MHRSDALKYVSNIQIFLITAVGFINQFSVPANACFVGNKNVVLQQYNFLKKQKKRDFGCKNINKKFGELL